MSEVRDNWERLVQTVLKREELRQLAYCESLSSAISTDFSSRLSDDSYLKEEDVGDSAREATAGGITNAVGDSVRGAIAEGIRIEAENKASGANAGKFAAAAARLFSAPAVALARYRRRKPRDHFSDFHLGQLERFSLRELQVATDNFSQKNILGRGGNTVYGDQSANDGLWTIYKGRLADGSLVAVKRRKGEPVGRGELQFHIEVEMASMDVHCNILHLRGFCMETKERLLVYPLMVNGSVASYLRERPKSQPPLDWSTRQRIALGSAQGLAYLHDKCDPKVIHRNVESANIFLDEDFRAVIGGLGSAIFMDYEDTDDVTMDVCGTIGHIAPEYLSLGRCSEKADVYSYGIMLLELITAQRAFSLDRLANDDDVMLLNLVKERLKNKKLEMLVDTDLQGNYIHEKVEQLIQVALICTQGSPMQRPKMSEVIRMLQGHGLAERWEKWQKEEMFPQDSFWTHHVRGDRIIDSTSDIESEEFLEPR